MSPKRSTSRPKKTSKRPRPKDAEEAAPKVSDIEELRPREGDDEAAALADGPSQNAGAPAVPEGRHDGEAGVEAEGAAEGDEGSPVTVDPEEDAQAAGDDVRAAAEELADAQAQQGDDAQTSAEEPADAQAQQGDDAQTSAEEPADAQAQQGDDAQTSAEEPADVQAQQGDDAPDGSDGADGSDEEVDQSTQRAHLKKVIESLVFVSERVVTANQLGRAAKTRVAEVRELIAELQQEYEGRGIELVEVGGGYQFRSAAVTAPFVRDFVSQRPVRLTRAQLETLALVAYRQPITRPEIDDVRGVDTGSAVKVLLDRGLVKILGRKDEAGRPLLYGTTPYFLEFFGMSSLKDLPTLREFSDLTDEHRELFRRKTGESVEEAETALAEAEAEREAARAVDEGAVDGSADELNEGPEPADGEAEAEVAVQAASDGQAEESPLEQEPDAPDAEPSPTTGDLDAGSDPEDTGSDLEAELSGGTGQEHDPDTAPDLESGSEPPQAPEATDAADDSHSGE